MTGPQVIREDLGGGWAKWHWIRTPRLRKGEDWDAWVKRISGWWEWAGPLKVEFVYSVEELAYIVRFTVGDNWWAALSEKPIPDIKARDTRWWLTQYLFEANRKLTPKGGT